MRISDSNTYIPLGFAGDELFDTAQALASTYHFTLDNHALPRLNLTADRLELLIANFSPLFINFNDPMWERRRNAGKQQGLVRACKPKPGMRILDVTAGWGRDAAVLASLGAEVTMLERQPIMAALLADALKRLNQTNSNPLALNLVYKDALDYLQDLSKEIYPDVIYIDPMHPERQKSALVKKDMQALQTLFGPDLDANQLIQLACKRTRNRVVVKWPQNSPPLVKPDQSFPGKTIRFDLYLRNALNI
ncbi:MAG: class I SAM-dependent methyltransferase [Legionellaceae bacterium]|nr:class I SAM-dependent methyltransferase [Legionellaceae bacterium]